MEKRHKHVSPTLDIMAKKIFSLPEVTVAFIRDILDLDVVDAQILEGTQLHKKDFDAVSYTHLTLPTTERV